MLSLSLDTENDTNDDRELDTAELQEQRMAQSISNEDDRVGKQNMDITAS